MRVRVRLKKMSKGDAQFISMVRRGANMLPFRIQKAASEDGMDLATFGKLFTRALKSDTTPEKPFIGAVVVHKHDSMDETIKVLQKAGFKTDVSEAREDGTVVFKQTDSEPEVGTIVRMSENMAVVMKSFEPWSREIKTFSDQLGVEGYMEGLTVGTRALQSVVAKCVSGSKTHQEMKSSVTKAINDFSSYAQALCEAIPPQAFHADEDLMAVEKAACDKRASAAAEMPHDEMSEEEKKNKEKAMKTDEVKPTETTPATPVVAPAPEAVVKADPTPAPAPEVTPATTQAEPVKPEPTPAPVVKADEPTKPDPLAAILSAVEAVQKSVGALAEKVTAVETAQKSQSERLDTVVRKADETEKRITGTVLAPPPSGDPNPSESVKKSADPMGTGYFDTALHGRGQK